MNLLQELIRSKLTGGEGGGQPPSGTISITENGTYDVAQYAEADVAVAASGGHKESGVVSFHTGEALGTLTIPISPTAQNMDFILYARPIRTWILDNGVWVERNTLDFTGTTGFKTGTWTPLLLFICGMRLRSPVNGETYLRFTGVGQYSNGTIGNTITQGTFVRDEENNQLILSNFNGAKVCVADCGLTYEYVIQEVVS